MNAALPNLTGSGTNESGQRQFSSELIREHALVARLIIQDKKAFHYLYEHYSASLFGVVFRIVKDQESAEEVLQDAFMKIWKNVDSYDVNRGRLYTWMMNIARNAAIDYLKTRACKNQKLNEDLNQIESSVERNYHSSQSTDSIGLKYMLHVLKPDLRCIVDLIYFSGYTHTEAAEKLSIPVGTLKTRLRMAIIQLRKLFN